MPARGESYVADSVVVTLDRRIITERELLYWAFEEMLFDPEGAFLSRSFLTRFVLTEAVDELLLADWAEFELVDIEIPASEIDNRVARIRQRFEQLAGGQEQLVELLNDWGLSYREWRIWISNRSRQTFLIQQALAREVGNQLVNLADDTSDNAINLRIAHILLLPEGPTREDERLNMERALTLRRNLAAGLSFNDAARLYSDDPSTAQLGGDLGWMRKEQMNPDLLEAVQNLRQDEISAPVETSLGVHIVKLLDFETEMRSEYRRQMEDARRRRLMRLRESVDIVLADGFRLDPVPEPSEPGPPTFWDLIAEERAAITTD